MLVQSGNLAVHLAAANNSSNTGLFNLLFIVVLVVGAYLLFLRPARMRQRKALETRSNVEPGVEVVTTAGLIANVVSTDDETVTLEIAPGVHSRFLKQAIVRVVEPDPPPQPGPDHEALPPADDTPPEPHQP